MMKAIEMEKKNLKNLLKPSEWKIERKFDGMRCFFAKDRLLSSDNINENHKFEHILKVLKGKNCVLDGEICLEDGSLFDINSKENWDKAVYIVFDVLEFEGTDLRDLTLKDRFSILENMVRLLDSPFIKLPQTFSDFDSAWDYIVKNNLEGLILKRWVSKYVKTNDMLETFRSKNWIKVKYWKDKDVEFNNFEIHEDKKGITLTNGFHRVSFRGNGYEEVRKRIEELGKVVATVRYLTETEDGHLFQPTISRIFGVFN